MEGPSGARTPTVTLVIKAPNQRYSDQTVHCPPDWTVGRLKAHLAEVYPGKPATKDQRLVYSGRLLPDHMQLKDSLRKQDEYHMVHLVCASRTPPSSPPPSSRRGSEEALTSVSSYSSDNSGSSTPSSSQETLATTASSSTEGLRHRNPPPAPAPVPAPAPAPAPASPANPVNPAQTVHYPYMMQGYFGNQFPGPALPAGFPIYPAFSPLQMLWWQQMYARQYYMQYQAAVSAQAFSNADPARLAAAQAPNMANVPARDPPPVPHAAAPENRALNQNVQMNAQGGPVANEEDLNRDWLDWMYTFSRAAILLSIVYFYSSFSRFVMVMGAMLLVYLHQAGWLPFRQDGVPLQVPNNADVNPDGQHGNNADLEEMEHMMDDGLDDESEEDAGEEASAGPQPGLMASAWSFITTFFTSLIPEGPPQVAN